MRNQCVATDARTIALALGRRCSLCIIQVIHFSSQFQLPRRFMYWILREGNGISWIRSK